MGNFATKTTASSDNVQWIECHNAVTAFVATTASAPTTYKHCFALDSALKSSATAAQWCARVFTHTCTFTDNPDDDDARWELVDCLQEAPGAFEATDAAFKCSLESLRRMRECIVQCHREQHANTPMPLSSHIEVDACTVLATVRTPLEIEDCSMEPTPPTSVENAADASEIATPVQTSRFQNTCDHVEATQTVLEKALAMLGQDSRLAEGVLRTARILFTLLKLQAPSTDMVMTKAHELTRFCKAYEKKHSMLVPQITPSHIQAPTMLPRLCGDDDNVSTQPAHQLEQLCGREHQRNGPASVVAISPATVTSNVI